ncbi:MAG: BamA/TamA family outer membrane protein [Candidatus Marinamargulisbacteria bacterium]
MGNHSKRIIALFLILPSLAYGAYIKTVIVTENEPHAMHQELVDLFQGSIRSTDQLDRDIARFRERGILRSLTYTLTPAVGGHILKLNAIYTPIIKHIRIKNAPINPHYLKGILKNKNGHHLNYKYLSDDIDAINATLVKNGYFLANTYAIVMSPQQELIIYIESPTVQKVEFIGATAIPPRYITRDLLTKNGQTIHQDTLDIDLYTLNNLPFFSSVQAPKIRSISSKNVTLTYITTPRKKNRFDIGIEELENNQGVALFTKIKRYNNFIYTDFIELQMQLGYLNNFNVRSYQLHYNQPWLLNRYPLMMDASMYVNYRSELRQDDTTVYSTIRQGSSLFFTKKLRKTYITIGAGGRYERVSPQVSGDFSDYNIRTMGLFVEKNTIKNRLNPQQGHRSKMIYDIGGNVAGVSLGGVSFSRLSMVHAQYMPIMRHHIFAAQIMAGTYHKNSSTPTFESEKFSLGGASSLRGFKEFAMYGNHRLSINLEQRMEINKQLLWVLFYDAGYINNTGSGLFDHYFQGYGTGVRFLNTVIPIRLDLAKGDDIILHLGVSQTF